MEKILKIVTTFAVLTALSGCSWRNYFAVFNTTKQAVTLVYKINEVEKGFPIFTRELSLYTLNSANEIDWKTKRKATSLYVSSTATKINIPTGTALIFGELDNDHYITYNQYFINNRIFNLKELEIQQNNKLTKIIPSNFDAFFKQINGIVRFDI
jgi:hypothetical protein